MKKKKPEKLNIEMCLEAGMVRERLEAQGQEMKALHATIARLTTELAEAREDSERLEEIKAAAAHLLANDGGKYSEGFSYADAKIARERLRGLLSDTELSAATTPFRRYESNRAAIAARKGGK